MDVVVSRNGRCDASLQIECMRCFLSAVVNIYNVFHNERKNTGF
jgi:hypothetical protein